MRAEGSSYKNCTFLGADDGHAVCACRYAQCAVMRCYGQARSLRLVPKKCGRQVDCIQCAELGRHRLRGALQNSGVHVDELNRCNEIENRRAAQRYLSIV